MVYKVQRYQRTYNYKHSKSLIYLSALFGMHLPTNSNFEKFKIHSAIVTTMFVLSSIVMLVYREIFMLFSQYPMLLTLVDFIQQIPMMLFCTSALSSGLNNKNFSELQHCLKRIENILNTTIKGKSDNNRNFCSKICEIEMFTAHVYIAGMCLVDYYTFDDRILMNYLIFEKLMLYFIYIEWHVMIDTVLSIKYKLDAVLDILKDDYNNQSTKVVVLFSIISESVEYFNIVFGFKMLFLIILMVFIMLMSFTMILTMGAYMLSSSVLWFSLIMVSDSISNFLKQLFIF